MLKVICFYLQALAGEPEGIKLFAVMLHTHLAGYSVRLRHFRNGVELPSIDQDDSYDFNYQEARMLQEEVVVLPVSSYGKDSQSWKYPGMTLGIGSAIKRWRIHYNVISALTDWVRTQKGSW